MFPRSPHRPSGRAGLACSLALLVIADAAAQVTVEDNVNISRMIENQSEIAIAINPAHPNQLFAASVRDGSKGLFAAYSPDGGQTWRSSAGANDADPADFIIADPDDTLVLACCDPSVAWDQFGNLFLAYLSLHFPFKIVIVVSLDGGRTFAPLTELGFEADQPTIVAGPGSDSAAGSVWVTYREYEGSNPGIVAHGIPVSGLGVFGAFGAQQSMGSEGNYGDIELGPNGQVLVTYQVPDAGMGPAAVFVHLDPDGLGPAGFGPAVFATMSNVGGFDGIPAQSDRTIDVEADLAYDRSCVPGTRGRAYLVYTDEVVDEGDDTDILVRSSDDDGVTWSDPIRVNDDPPGRSQFNPRIVADPVTGVVALSWHDARHDDGDLGSGDTDGIPNTDTQLFATISLDGGITFAPNVRVSQGTSNEDGSDNPNLPPGEADLDYGDYDALAMYDGNFFPAWADNSNSTGDNPDGALRFFDVYTARVRVNVPPPGPVPDSDLDGINDCVDNCIDTANPGQEDADGDREGDACDLCTDLDGDGFGETGFPLNTCEDDNCPSIVNEGQEDADGDGAGDACDPCTDRDGDGFGDAAFPQNTCADDNCPLIFNVEQEDADGDGAGDLCDSCTDRDGDGFGDPGFPVNTCAPDNCPQESNTSQADADGDGIGDACDACTDTDSDGFGDPGFAARTCAVDNCPTVSNLDQSDANGDGSGDACQPTLVLTDIVEDGGEALEVRARAQDPQDEPLSGSLQLLGSGVLNIEIVDVNATGDCSLGYLPAGVPGEGIGFAFGSVGEPFLFDLDAVLFCGDGSVDYLLAVGECDSPGLFFDFFLPLSGQSPPFAVCMRKAGSPDDSFELVVTGYDPASLSATVAVRTGLVVDLPFTTGLPRQVALAGLEAGTTYDLSITVTDGNTVPVSAGRSFLYQGESRLVINNAPRAVIAAPAAAECDHSGGALVALDGTGSEDDDSTEGTADDIAGYVWVEDPGQAGETVLGEGPVLERLLAVGPHTIGLRVSDTQGETDLATTVVTVRDTMPPTLAVLAAPAELWPPNHGMVPVRVTWQVSDVCDTAPAVRLEGVSSSEPDDAPGEGDGNTTGDIAGADAGTADGEVLLRAERAARGAGRVYEVRYRASDASGNSVPGVALVRVPHDRGNGSEPLLLRLEPDATPGGTRIDWAVVTGAAGYDVIEGELTEVRPGNGLLRLGPVRVLARGTARTAVETGAAAPEVGRAYFYLVQQRDAQGGVGYGTDTAPWPRAPTACDDGCP